MIKFNWVLPSTGEELTKISITHTLSREDLANLLAAAKSPNCFEDMTDLSKAEIERAIRELLATHPENRHWWRDDYREADGLDVTADDVFEWAKSQIDRL